MTKISQLSSIGDSLAVGDQFLIRDIDDITTPNKSVTVSGITRALDVGTALAPAIAFASDKNTGIYSPGADQVAISTGGSERLRIDSSGRVGIGTSSPVQKLEVNGGSIGVGNAAGTDAKLSFDVIGVAGGAIGFNDSGNTNIYGIPDNTAYVGLGQSFPLAFSTGAQERLRIDSSGRVGIGTSSPATTSALEVSGNQRYLSITANAGSGGPTNPATSSGLHLSWNRSNGEGESNIIYGTGAGGAPGLAIGSWNGTTYNERLRIDSSGRLLVGTSTSIDNLLDGGLQVVGTAADSYLTVTRYSSFASDPAGIILGRSKSATKGTNTSVASGDSLGVISFSGANGTTFNQAANIIAFVDGTPGANDMPGRLVFSTTADGASSPTERMRIDSSGNVGIGTTALAVTPRISVQCANFGIAINTTNGGANEAMRFYNAGTAVGTITTTGSATAYNTSSDYRLKENIEPVADGITRLKQLNPSRFNFITDPDRTVDGFIAHEVQVVVPEAITGEKDAEDDDGNPIYQGIDQSKLVPLLTAALQEATAKIETLEAKVAALEDRLTAAGI